MNNKKHFALNIPIIISLYSSVTPVTMDCDACSPVDFVKRQIPQTNLFSTPYYIDPILVKQNVGPTHYAVSSPFSETFSVLNEGAMICLQHFGSPKLLESIPSTWSEVWGEPTVQSILDRLMVLGLLVPENHIAPTLTEVSDTLAVWLHITDRCNLRCAYCYLSHHNTEMSTKTGRAAIEATFRSAISHQYREVKLKYAGGEPLLRFPFVKKLHRYAQVLAEKYGLELDGVVLSNGTLLTEQTVKEMKGLGLRLMISLDSLPTSYPSQDWNIHPCPSQEGNTQRVYPDGRNASKEAIRGIELALECGLIPDISITVSGRNVGDLPELLVWVLERDLPFSLNFYRENDCSKRNVCGTSDLQLEEGKIITGMLAAYKVIEANLPRRSLLASLVDRANLAATHLQTCSVGHSYLVFDPLGRISKCQMQFDKPVTTVQADDPLGLIRADEDGIQNLSVEEKEGCRSCKWKYWCAGSCPLETYRATGRYDIQSPNCNIYKALYPEVLRLEGLRLLKYASS